MEKILKIIVKILGLDEPSPFITSELEPVRSTNHSIVKLLPMPVKGRVKLLLHSENPSVLFCHTKIWKVHINFSVVTTRTNTKV